MTDPVTNLHYAANGIVESNGVYTPGVDGFNLADVSSLDELNALPAGVKGLVYLNMTDGVTPAFEAAVDQYIGNPNLYGFFVADQPTTVPAATIKAEVDYIHANVPGAITFMWIQNTGTPTNPVYNLYNPQNTDIDLFGISPQPVQPQLSGGYDLNVIPDAVNAAVAGGIPLANIVPIYQAFGGGGDAPNYTLPTASQEQQILSTWGALLPNPAFDFAYSWGVQNGDNAISNEPSLQQVFAANNAEAANALALAGSETSPNYTPGGIATTLESSLTVSDASSTTLAGATVAISGGFQSGDQLNFTNQAGIVGSYDATTGTLTLTGTATLAAYQTALESIAYSSTSADPSAAGTDPLRTITWTASDGAASSLPFTSFVKISLPSSTLSTSYNGTLTLMPGYNPFLITASGSVTATAANADAVDGGSSVNWQIANNGAVSSSSAYGINLAGSGDIANTGSISGTGGINISNDGTVTNSAGATITATGATTGSPSLASVSAIYVTGPAGGGVGAIQVNNSGAVGVQAGAGYGIGLGASGSVINSGQVTGGEDGIIVLAGDGEIENSGSIVANVDDGATLLDGGTVTNATGASISGVNGATSAGIWVTGASGTVNNSGDVTGNRYGVLLTASGAVNNYTGATITGSGSGVTLSQGGTLSNSGVVSATSIAPGINAAGADLELGGAIDNNQGASISGTAFGAFITGGEGAVVNAGSMTGTTYYGVSLNDGGSVTNNVSGSISGNGAGVSLSNQPATVANYGAISATAALGAGVLVNAGGQVNNYAGGTLSGAGFGVFASTDSATFSNSGTATGADAVGLEAGGTVANLSGGILSGQNAGVYIAGAPGTVTNSGSISAGASGGAGIDLQNSGSITNNAGGTVSGGQFGLYSAGGSAAVVNAAGASISGGSTAVSLSGSANTLTNYGAITTAGAAGIDLEGGGDVLTNASGATISASSYGVFVDGVGTVTNLGSISGGSYAVDFAVNSGANLLQVGAGATFAGSVNGNGGTLELMSGSGSIGGVSNAGQFYGFQALTVDSGANWSLTGTANSIANLNDNGALTISGALDVTGALNPSGVGALDLSPGGILELASDTGSQTAVDFLGASQLKVDNAALFGTGIGGSSYQGSLLENFGVGDSVDLLNFSSQNAAFTYDPTSGLLQVSNGAQQATLEFQQSTLGGGTFQLGADALGTGTAITFLPNVFTVAAFEANQAQLDTISGGFSILDTSTNVLAALSSLNADGHVVSIKLTDTGTPTLTITVAQLISDATALSKITTPYTITISDTAANVAANLNALNGNTHITSIALTDTGTPALTLNAAQALGDTTALGEITTPYTIAISDTAANVSANFNAINGDAHVTSIALTDSGTPALALTAAQALGDTATLAKITTPYTISISDSAANVAANIATLNGDSQVTSIALTDAGTPALKLSVAQALGDTTALGEITTPYTITISDTAANVVANLSALSGDAHVTSIAFTDTGTPALALTVAQIASDAAALGEITTPYAITISDTAASVAANLNTLNGNTHVRSIALTDPGTPALTLNAAQALSDTTALGEITTPYTIAISDTAANVSANFNAINADAHVKSIALTDAGTPTLTLTIAEALTDSVALGEISTAHNIAIADTAANILALTAAKVSSLSALHVAQIAATDTSVALSTSLATALEASNIHVTAPAGSAVTLSDLSLNLNVMSLSLIAGLPALGVSRIVSTNGSVVVNAQQSIALEGVGLHISGPGGAAITVTLTDLAANIAVLSTAQIAALVGVGVSRITATGASVAFNVAQALALETAKLKLSVPTGDTFTVSDTAANVEALTGAQITALPGIGVGGVGVSDAASVTLTEAQAAAFESSKVILSLQGGQQASLSDTAANIHLLSAAQIAGLSAIHVTQIRASDTTVNLTVAQAAALETAGIPVSAPSGSHVAVSDSAANLQTLTAAQISALIGIGVTNLVSTNTAVKFTVAQTLALEGSLLTVTPYGTTAITVSDTGAAIAGLTASQIGLLHSTGFTALASTSGGVTLNLAQALALESPAIKITVPTGSVVAVSDSAANIQALTTTQILGLKSIGVTSLLASGANVVLTVAQATALEAAGVALSPPSGGNDSIVDTAGNIQLLTAAQIAGLGALHVTLLTASDTNVSLTAAQAKALETVGIPVSAPSGSDVAVSDTAANLQALTVAQITALPSIGVSGLTSNNAAVKFTVAQTLALENSHLTVAPFVGTKVTLSDTGANIATLTTAEIGLLTATGFAGLTSTTGGVTLNVQQAEALEGVSLKITPPSGSKVTISDLAANIAAMTASQLAALSGTGVVGITATDTSVNLSLAQALALESPAIKITVPSGSVVAVSDTAGNIQALTATQIAGLKSVGVTSLSASDTNVVLTVAQADALEGAGVGLSPPSGGHDLILDTAANIQTLTPAQIASLSALHSTQIQVTDTTVNLTVAQAKALETAAIPVAVPGGSHVAISDTAANLQTLTSAQITGLSAIDVTGLNSSNANVSYNSTQTSAILAADLTLSAVGADTVSQTFTNNAVIASSNSGAGSGTLTLATNSNGVTVNAGTALSVTAGGEMIPLTSYANETINATGRTSEAFEFTPGVSGSFWQDTITGLLVGSASTHDLLEFNASAFGVGLTAANQSADLIALLADTTNNAAGNAVITDLNGDALTLTGVSKATISLAANAVDFRFV